MLMAVVLLAFQLAPPPELHLVNADGSPRVACVGAWGCCDGCAGTGPTCEYEFDMNGNSLYTCSVPSCGGSSLPCSYNVVTGGNACHCYDFDGSVGFFEIPCPFNDCDHGQCKTCQLDKPARRTVPWGKVKDYYR